METKDYLKLIELKGFEIEVTDKRYIHEDIRNILEEIEQNLSISKVTTNVLNDKTTITVIEFKKSKNCLGKRVVAQIVCKFNEFDNIIKIIDVEIIASSLWNFATSGTNKGMIEWIEIDDKILFEGSVYNKAIVTIGFKKEISFPIVEFKGDTAGTVKINLSEF